MDPLIPDEWLVFRPRIRELTESAVKVLIETERSDGSVGRELVRLPLVPFATVEAGFRNLLLEEELYSFFQVEIAAAIEGFEFGRTRFGERVPFPVFVHAARSVRQFPWDRVVEAVASRFEVPIQVMGMAASDFRVARKLTLPVRVEVLAEAGSALDGSMREAESRMHYLAEPEVREYGWRTLYRTSAPREWAEGEVPHIIISEARFLRSVSSAVGRAFDRPRLLVTIDHSPPAIEIARGGFAHVHFSSFTPERDVAMLHDFLEAIVHDFPLHEAFHHTRRRYFEQRSGEISASPPFLIADPGSNQSLRLSDAIESLEQEAFTLRQQSGHGDSQAFFARLGALAEPLMEGLSAVQRAAAPAAEALALVRGAEIDLRWEGRGLVPMSKALRQVAQARAAQGEISSRAAELLSVPANRALFEEHLERRVDGSLLRADSAGVFNPVAASEPLAGRTRYRLRVHIGQREDGSLMVGSVPALDPLLPPLPREQPHELIVVVFGKDFILHSPTSQLLELPRFGGSAPAHFDVETPAYDPNALTDETPEVRTVRSTGLINTPQAELRFGIYFRNRLLQSFRLQAAIGEPIAPGVPQVRIECDFSQTARFFNLDQLKPRLMSLSLNRDGSESHTLMLERDGRSASIRWSTIALAHLAEGIRGVLEAATRDAANGARFAFTEQLEVADPNSPEFDTTVRLLAQAGGELYDELYLSHAGAEDFLEVVRTAPTDTIETVRHDLTYVFPWGLLYDFTRPDPGSPEDCQPVCRGVVRDGSPCDCANVAPGTASRYCLRGFWAIRHRVEQLVWPGGEPRDAAELIGPPRPATTVGFFGPVRDAYVQALCSRLSQPQGFCVEYPSGPAWLSLVYPVASRPAILVTISHLDQGTGASGLRQSRLQLDDAGGWLEARHFVEELRAKRGWEKPQQPLLLLMACNAGFTRLDSATTFAGNFLRLGAGGVVASDCTVFTGLAARFVRDLVAELKQNIPMGEAMRRCTERLAREGCPLGFVFNYLGSAELQLSP